MKIINLNMKFLIVATNPPQPLGSLPSGTYSFATGKQKNIINPATNKPFKIQESATLIIM